ncbi:late embryogenesis abundant protein 29-like [Canna indica]|uniref:Late embryogenesis abundant protein 29-like n=1 Tax=Canna indica TaxID=4628 RepID=A0AAQ3KL80_9LILI|nr:late embryogenesis abundant protein 29-like [Canna indica]
MADQFNAGKTAGQAQMQKDQMVDKASQACQQGMEQAGGMMQQTGDRMRNMAEGAADAVKSAMGMGGTGNSSAPTATRNTTTTTSNNNQ